MNADKEFIIHFADSRGVDEITELHCALFCPENNIPVALGKEFVKATYRWQVNSKDTYVLIAEMQRKIVGMIGVCDGSHNWKMVRACFWPLIGSLIRRPSLMFDRILWVRIFRRNKHRSALTRRLLKDYSLAQVINVAVESGCQRMGIFRKLVECAMAVSKKRGSKGIRAGVYKDNIAGCRAFTNLGWMEFPILQTTNTVFYLASWDPAFPNELGIEPGK